LCGRAQFVVSLPVTSAPTFAPLPPYPPPPPGTLLLAAKTNEQIFHSFAVANPLVDQDWTIRYRGFVAGGNNVWQLKFNTARDNVGDEVDGGIVVGNPPRALDCSSQSFAVWAYTTRSGSNQPSACCSFAPMAWHVVDLVRARDPRTLAVTLRLYVDSVLALETTSSQATDNSTYRWILFNLKDSRFRPQDATTTTGVGDIEIYGVGPVPAAPTILQSDGLVSISALSNGPIYYSVDGVDPRVNLVRYAAPFLHSGSRPVLAVVFDSSAFSPIASLYVPTRPLPPSGTTVPTFPVPTRSPTFPRTVTSRPTMLTPTRQPSLPAPSLSRPTQSSKPTTLTPTRTLRPTPPYPTRLPTRSPTTIPTGALLDMGCWMDTSSRALRGGPQRFGYNVETCKAEARARFSTIFALQAGGWCTTSDGTDNYMQYGRASSCPALGGPWINHVFSIAGLPSPISPMLHATVIEWRQRGRDAARGRG
jgi:hypothetical protein